MFDNIVQSTPVQVIQAAVWGIPEMFAEEFAYASGAPIPRGMRFRVTSVEHGVRTVSRRSSMPVISRVPVPAPGMAPEDQRELPYCQIRFEVTGRFGRMIDRNAVITIDKERERLIPPWSSWLWCRSQRVNIAQALVTLPALLVSSPLWSALSAVRSAKERAQGCERNHALILKKLKPQLDPDVYNLYRRAVAYR